jgi:hypothetical protein
MNKQNINSETSAYLKHVKALLPVNGKRERAFLRELAASVEDYIESSPSDDIRQARLRFGEPTKVVSEYLSNADADYLSGQVKRLRHIRIIVCALVALVILSIGIEVGLNYKNYLEAEDSYLTVKETVVERD